MNSFEFMETTIADIHAAMSEKKITCRDLVEFYLKRIDAYDKKGPRLNSVITINPKAREEADRLDTEFKKTGKFSGPLHGIPVLLKDNINTFDMPTTAGSLSLADFIPEKDAFIAARLRKAGAVILAKTNLHEFAIWGETISSILGQTLNPYDLTRTPGGSSGGSGAGIAANFGVIGLGTDTVNSVRSPCSANSLAGIRPTMGLVSRDGIVPYSLTQDTAGPICRTVEDAARTLDVIAGYDSADAETAWCGGMVPQSYTAFLKKDGMRGRRIGVLESFFGREEKNAEVNRVVREAIGVFAKNGADAISITENIDSGEIGSISVHLDDLKDHLNAYLAAQNAPVKSLEEVMASGKYHPGIKANLEKAAALSVGTPEYNKKLALRAGVRTRIMKLMEDYRLDAVVYPHQQQLVCKTGGAQEQRNGVLCSVTGFPSVVVPAGFSVREPDAPLGVPVGMEIIGRPWSEQVLIGIAYGFEQASRFRKAPLGVPDIK
jgi:Asp-tRNA(Asn)/Glu-tRNA(Gln) amidotransferase A subunit family amidase